MFEEKKTISLSIPKINWQITALVIIAIVAAFQTIQLAQLKGNVTVKAASPAHAAPAASGGLQEMVGGC